MVITLCGTSNFILNDAIKSELDKTFTVEQRSVGASNYSQWLYSATELSEGKNINRMLILDSIVNDEILTSSSERERIFTALQFVSSIFPVIFVEFTNNRYFSDFSWVSNFYRDSCRTLGIPFFSYIDCLKYIFRHKNEIPMRDEGHPMPSDLTAITRRYFVPFIEKRLLQYKLKKRNTLFKEFSLIHAASCEYTLEPIRTKLGVRYFYRGSNFSSPLCFTLPDGSKPVALALSTHDTSCCIKIFDRENPLNTEYSYSLFYERSDHPLFKIVLIVPPSSMTACKFTDVHIVADSRSSILASHSLPKSIAAPGFSVGPLLIETTINKTI